MLLFFVNPKELLLKSGHFTGMYPIKIAIFGGLFGFILIIFVKKYVNYKFERICEIEIGYKEKIIKLKALVDSRKSSKRYDIEFTSCYCRKE